MKLKELIDIAILEGEGIGTAYEYYSKLKLLDKVMSDERINNLLIYGLPEKYGYSLDFIMFGISKKCLITIVDERKSKIIELKKILKEIKINYKINFLNKDLINIETSEYDLVLSNEVMQRLNRMEVYIQNIRKAKNYMIFVPNSNNHSHEKYSKLKGFELFKLNGLFPKTKKGYIDIPLFEAGEKISFNKREILKKFYFLLYLLYLIELIMPKFIKKRKAHICYITP